MGCHQSSKQGNHQIPRGRQWGEPSILWFHLLVNARFLFVFGGEWERRRKGGRRKEGKKERRKKDDYFFCLIQKPKKINQPE